MFEDSHQSPITNEKAVEETGGDIYQGGTDMDSEEPQTR